ncbi:SMCs flexible hinge [Chiua virens]|nr:SMCs flexible hinge [Chiua virens]
MAQGQACIDFLRSQNISHTSFMVLEKLPSDHIHKCIQTPKNVLQLYDLIKSKDPKFLPVFYKAVGNTLIADDLEQANRIVFRGSRQWR